VVEARPPRSTKENRRSEKTSDKGPIEPTLVQLQVNYDLPFLIQKEINPMHIGKVSERSHFPLS
jgi:hypothetical protein